MVVSKKRYYALKFIKTLTSKDFILGVAEALATTFLLLFLMFSLTFIFMFLLK